MNVSEVGYRGISYNNDECVNLVLLGLNKREELRELQGKQEKVEK